MFITNKIKVSLLLALSIALFSETVSAADISGVVWRDVNADTLKGDNANNTVGSNILKQTDTSQVGDLGSNTYGNPAVTNAGLEAGFENVTLCVTGTATCTTSAANGSYTLNVPVGESITISAPAGFKFSSDNPAGDNDADQQGAPVPPAPWTAIISPASIVSGNTDVGLRPLPVIQLSFLDLNAIPGDGVQGIETGTPSYNALGNCTTSAPYSDPADPQLNSATEAGDDCHKYDNTVRTNDIVTFTPSLTLDNAPAGGIDNLILEMQFSPVLGAEIVIDTASASGIPTACQTGAGFSPSSQVINNPDGSIKLICNLGNIENGQLFAPISIKPTGNSPDGSSITTEMRSYAAANNAVPSPELPSPSIEISAAPRFDITKNSYSATSPRNTTGFYPNYSSLNHITGQTELGLRVAHQISIMVDSGSDGKGISSLGNSFSFEEVIDPRYKAFGARVEDCSQSPWASSWDAPWDGNGALPYQDNRTIDNGSWTCATDGSSNTITITDADTSGNHYPTKGANDRPTAPHKIVVTGVVVVWYPNSALYRFAGPDKIFGTADDGSSLNPNDANLWQYGEEPITGSYPLTNCLGSFDPNSLDAQGNTVSNYGAGFEPGWDGATASGNNCRNNSFRVQSVGSFHQRYTGDHRLDNNALRYGIAPAWSWACSGDPDVGIVSGQTACDSGDGPIAGTQIFSSTSYLTAGSSAVDLADPKVCTSIDNSVYKLSPIPSGNAAGKYAFSTYHDQSLPAIDGGANILGYVFSTDHHFKLEYARFTAASGRKTWQNNHAAGAVNPINSSIPVDHSQQTTATADCGDALTTDGNLEWTETPDTAGWNVDDIVMVRVVGDATKPKLQVGDRLLLFPNFEARTNFYSPDFPSEDGNPIALGTLFPNLSNYAYDANNDDIGDYGNPVYNATNHTSIGFGDRLIYQNVIIAIEKQAYKAFNGSTVGDNDLLEEFAGDPIMWSLHPSVSAVSDTTKAKDLTITDILPPYTSYAASCSPTLPAGVSGPQIIPNTPNAGETTLIYTYDNPVDANVALDPISICINTDSFAPAPVDVLNKATIKASNVAYAKRLQETERAVRLLQIGRFAVKKEVDAPLDFQNKQQVWTLIWANTSEFIPFVSPDIIDVFPFNGDGPAALAAREQFSSAYTGTLNLSTTPAIPMVTKAAVSQADTGQWYVTGDDPATIDPNPSAAGDAKNNLATGTSNWCAVPASSVANPPALASNGNACSAATLADVTAIRWVSSRVLDAGESTKVDINLQATTNKPNDIYVNRFTAYSATFLNEPVRSNEPFIQVVGFSLGDLIWLDMNGNGIFDEGTDITAPAGVTVNLFDATNTAKGNTTTDANGRWFFEGIDAGQYYVTVGNLPTGWLAGTAAQNDPNTDLNEVIDHHAINNAGTIRSAGLIELSATIVGDTINGDEPTGDNPKFIGNPLIRDDLTNFTLDLMMMPEVGNITVKKEVQGGGPLDGWQFAIVSTDPAGCPIPLTVTNPETTDINGNVSFTGLLVNDTSGTSTCEYTVSELPRAGWTLDNISPAGAFTLNAGGTTNLTATNIRETGSIEITKSVTGASSPVGWEFTLTSLIADCAIPAINNPASTADGSGGTVSFVGLPVRAAVDPFAECKYQIAETAQNGWTMTTALANLTDLTILNGETTSVAIENQQETGAIQVNKTVLGGNSPAAWEFTLIADIEGCVIPAPATVSTPNGANGSVSFANLPTHSSTQANTACTYSIAETNQNGWSMTTAPATLTGIGITSGASTAVAIENAKNMGSITVTKTVTGGASPTAWQFSLSTATAGCSIPADVSPKTTADGTGGTVTFSGLATHSSTTAGLACSYNVSETNQAGWAMTTAAADLTGLIVSNAASTAVTINNARQLGIIQVDKTVTGGDSLTAWEFTLTADTAGCAIPATTTNPASTPNGGNGSVSFANLPTHSATLANTACRYSVAETNQTGWSMTTAPENLANLAFSAGATTTVAIQNTKGSGSISVTKVVTGGASSAAWEFTLSTSTAGCNIPADVSPKTTADGTGGTVTFSGLATHSSTAAGLACSYDIAESSQTGWLMTTAATDLTGLVVTNGETTAVNVSNARQVGTIQVDKTVTGGDSLTAWEFTLTADTDGCAIPTATATTPSGASGAALFTELPTHSSTVANTVCNYTIAETKQDGWTMTTAVANLTDLSVTADQITQVAIENIKLGSISGNVFEDIDGTGDAALEPLENVTLTLLNPDGTVYDSDPTTEAIEPLTAQTNNAGHYVFDNVALGDYLIEETDLADYSSVNDNDSSDDGDTTANADTNDNRIPVTLSSAELDADNDFIDEHRGAITGNVTVQSNNDDPDSPLEGVTLSLLNEDGEVISTTTTDDEGHYIFADLPPGNYQVLQAQPEGYDSILDAEGELLDNLIMAITLNPGETIIQRDFVEKLTPAVIKPIPTLSEWSLLALILMLGWFGFRQNLVLQRKYDRFK